MPRAGSVEAGERERGAGAAVRRTVRRQWRAFVRSWEVGGGVGDWGTVPFEEEEEEEVVVVVVVVVSVVALPFPLALALVLASEDERCEDAAERRVARLPVPVPVTGKSTSASVEVARLEALARHEPVP